MLSALVRAGYHLIITGHSLGAGVASILHGRLTNKIKSESCLVDAAGFETVREGELGLFDTSECIGFGPPPVVSEALALRLSQKPQAQSSNAGHMFAGLVLSVVNRDDVVCRASAHNARMLVEDVIHGKEQWASSMKLDVQVKYLTMMFTRCVDDPLLLVSISLWHCERLLCGHRG